MDTTITTQKLKLWILTLQKYLLIILKCIGMNANDLAASIGVTPNTIRTYMANPIRAIMTKQTFISVMSYLDYCLTDETKSNHQRNNLLILMNAIFDPDNYKNYSDMVDFYMNKMRATTTRVLTSSTDTNKMLSNDMVEIDLYSDSIPIKNILTGYYSTFFVNHSLFDQTQKDKYQLNNIQMDEPYKSFAEILKPGMDSFDLEIAYLEKIKNEHPETKKEINETINRIKNEKNLAKDIFKNNTEELVMTDWQIDLDNKEKEIENYLQYNTTLLQDHLGIPLWQDYVFSSYTTDFYNELKTDFIETHKGDSSYLDNQIQQLLKEIYTQL